MQMIVRWSRRRRLTRCECVRGLYEQTVRWCEEKEEEVEVYRYTMSKQSAAGSGPSLTHGAAHALGVAGALGEGAGRTRRAHFQTRYGREGAGGARLARRRAPGRAERAAGTPEGRAWKTMQCLPRHPTHVEPSFLELNGIL